MSKRSLYQKYKIGRSQTSQIEGFTRAASTNIYRGAIRATRIGLGYRDNAVTLTDPTVHAELDRHAKKVTKSIAATYNAMLDRKIKSFPRGTSDTDVEAGLRSFFGDVRSYNTNTLMPFTERQVRGMAQTAFYVKNGIASTWRMEPADIADSSESKESDRCRDIRDQIASSGPVSHDTMVSIPFPQHQNCPHVWVAAHVDQSSLPAEGDEWSG